MKNSTFSLLVLLFSFLLFPFSIIYAATAVIEVDTGMEDINALEGTLVLPESLRVREIQTGTSVILMWVEEPHQTGNALTFAGITPGGFEGSYPVFTIHGVFTKEELEQVRFESVVALKNDGTGERAPVTMSLSLVAFKADAELPEEFTPIIATDPNIFDGKYFLVFATQDKSSGISRYEVREGRWGWFREAESPYLLEAQKLNQDVYVKAIDNTGNERVAVVPARVYSTWWENYGLFAILILMVLVVFAYKKIW
jgi:hypothetical protein